MRSVTTCLYLRFKGKKGNNCLSDLEKTSLVLHRSWLGTTKGKSNLILQSNFANSTCHFPPVQFCQCTFIQICNIMYHSHVQPLNKTILSNYMKGQGNNLPYHFLQKYMGTPMQATCLNVLGNWSHHVASKQFASAKTQDHANGL